MLLYNDKPVLDEIPKLNEFVVPNLKFKKTLFVDVPILTIMSVFETKVLKIRNKVDVVDEELFTVTGDEHIKAPLAFEFGTMVLLIFDVIVIGEVVGLIKFVLKKYEVKFVRRGTSSEAVTIP